MKPWMVVVAVPLLLTSGAFGAEANGPRFVSVYTDLDFDQCTTLDSDDMGSTSVCPGYRGYPVLVGEGDLRMFVSYGIKPTEEKAMQQTLPPFNHLGGKIEWRIEEDDEVALPRATITRWFTAGDGGVDKGQVLVVTQLKTGATCHIAYIDAIAVKDANQRARDIADVKAGSFDCAGEPEIVQPFRAY
ncbi:MAG: hypothetical protein ABI697_00345 [Devosia sp.]